MHEMLLQNNLTGKQIADIDTPALIVDLDAVRRNIEKMMSRFEGTGIAVRPHLKTVKTPAFAKMLIAAGASGVCVAKLAEAQIMVAAGIHDILITTEIAGKVKLQKLFNLLQQAPDARIVVDSSVHIDELSAMCRQVGYEQPINVLVEINVGQNRSGVASAEEALKLASILNNNAHFRFQGVQGYEGHLQLLTDEAQRQDLLLVGAEKLRRSVEMIRRNGIEVKCITGAGTGTCEYWIGQHLINEVQPGSFVFMDTAYRKSIGAKFENALRVVSTVISKPADNRIVIDAGMKALSTDAGNAEITGLGEARYSPAGDEHGIVESDKPLAAQIGQQVQLLPSHIDTTVNLYDEYYCHRNGTVEAVHRIEARGKSQ